MDRPLAVLAILLGVVALSLTVVGVSGPDAAGGRSAGGDSARLDDLGLGIRRAEREREALSKAQEALSAKIGRLDASLRRLRKSTVDREAIGRCCEKALRKRGFTFKGDEEKAAPGEKEGGDRKETGARKLVPEHDRVMRGFDAKAGAETGKVAKSVLDRLHERQRRALAEAGLTGEKAEAVVRLLEAERRGILDALRKHRGDRDGLVEARREIRSRTDAEAKKLLGAGEYEVYRKWRNKPPPIGG